MLIKVLGNDKSIGFFEDYYLEDFIKTRSIAAFFRNNSNEWVDIARDPNFAALSPSFYGDVAERLERAGIRYRFAYPPDRIPPERV